MTIRDVIERLRDSLYDEDYQEMNELLFDISDLSSGSREVAYNYVLECLRRLNSWEKQKFEHALFEVSVQGLLPTTLDSHQVVPPILSSEHFYTDIDDGNHENIRFYGGLADWIDLNVEDALSSLGLRFLHEENEDEIDMDDVTEDLDDAEYDREIRRRMFLGYYSQLDDAVFVQSHDRELIIIPDMSDGGYFLFRRQRS